MEDEFKIVIVAIGVIIMVLIVIGLVSLMGNQSKSLFERLLCPWC